ncbi:Superfamily II helicase and inactivated derivatives [Raoultella terrigena]|uniref:Superfamily II helicase and inactivated derivatives n=1 Tax=Raoultella terrigena TaxID=577 RepID=A0A3P8M0Z6_RAOTE|nr:Superfamily II helicase and inactivated derivatives [Raoultella terrigena]
MKYAPNVKALPKDKFTEAIIFAGADAYAHAQHWTESEGAKAGDKVPPVWLGTKQLAVLDELRIVDTGRQFVRVIRSGALNEIQISRIATKLALADVKEARLFSGMHDAQAAEDWTQQLPRLKAQAECGESVPSMLGEKRQHKSNEDMTSYVDERDDGLYWVTPKLDKETGEILRPGQILCNLLEVAGVGIGVDDEARYLILRWTPAGSKTKRTEAIPMRDIGDREGWARLRAGGLFITANPRLRNVLADHLLRDTASCDLWHIASVTGWQCGAYIMPDGEVIGNPDMPIMFNGRSSAASGYSVRGTVESWRNSIARLVEGNHSMMTAVAASLCGPLVGLTDSDGFGIHFYNSSSAGKTTTQSVASSLYGKPEALKLTWYGTALGLANEAASHNDALMPLDEIGQGTDPLSVYQSAYALFNGTGKLQGAKEGGNRELKRWRVVAISTGEVDMETFVATAGKKAKAGQLVRLINIPLTKATSFHGLKSGEAHARALSAAWLDNHGAAGREWVRFLAGHQKQAKDTLRATEQRWREIIPFDYGEQAHRVAGRFAVMEAALVLSAHITGWDIQACRDAIQHSWNSWIHEFGTANKEHQQIIAQCEAFLNAYGYSRFAPLPYSPADLPIQNLAGYRQKKGAHDTAPIIFYAFPGAFESEIASGFNPRQFARVLAESGMLTPPTNGRGFQRKSPRVDGRQVNVYVIQHLPDESDTGD